MIFTQLAAVFVFLAGATSIQLDRTTSDVIRDQTNITSTAGQRNDQATVDRMTADEVLFSAGDGAVQRDVKFDAIEPELLKFRRLTLECHSQIGGLRSCATSSALFIDQTGVLNPNGDVAGAAFAKVDRVADFIAHHVGDATVTSFTIVTPVAKLLAVEIWMQRGDHWRLVGGQTIPLNQDPHTDTLSSEALAEYAGTYSAGPGSSVVLAVDGDHLAATTNAGKPARLAHETHDTFFVPAQPAGYLRPYYRFQRDVLGQITGYLRNGIKYHHIEPTTPAIPFVSPSPGPLVLRGFIVHRTGDVAVAVFFHDRVTPFYGQVLRQTYRSMETWIKRDGAWKMISSQGRQL